MADRRPYIIALVVTVASLAVGAVSLLKMRPRERAPESLGSESGSSGGLIIPTSALSRLPVGTRLLDETGNGRVQGVVLCGRCVWEIGNTCNVMLWDGQHVLAVLPSEKLDALEKLRGP